LSNAGITKESIAYNTEGGVGRIICEYYGDIWSKTNSWEFSVLLLTTQSPLCFYLHFDSCVATDTSESFNISIRVWLLTF